MNKIMTIVFLLVIFNFYYLLGEFGLHKLGYEKENRLGMKLVAGFLLTFAVGFIIGFPAQLFAISWSLYSFIMLITYGSITAFLIYYNRHRIKRLPKQFKMNWKIALMEHFKEFWFLYVLVTIFSVLSMANQEAFLYMNYDDHYYIGKMVNEIGTTSLGNEDYYSGMLLTSSSLSLERLANSYEITYAFFSNLFHINVPFFCRVTMTIQNYIIVFLMYKNFSELILDRKKSQYSLLMFSILLIPHGFLMDSPNMPFGVNVRSYDGWQFQSAIFYGASIVRTIALPTILLFGKDLIVRFNLKKLLLVALFSMSFLSFSTIYFQICSLLLILFIFVKLVYLCYTNYKQSKYINLAAMVITIILGTFVFVKVRDYDLLLFFDIKTITNYQTLYPDFHLRYAISDIIMKITPFVLLISIFVFKKIEEKGLIVILLGLFVFLRFNFFFELIFTTSMGYFFVSLRTIAALQYFVIFLIGVIIIFLFSKNKYLQLSTPIISFCLIATTLGFVHKNFEEVKTYDFLGSGMVKEGYDFSRILNNDQMIPEVATKVGDYFNTLPYANYSLYVQQYLPYLDTNIDFSNFNVVSNRIELCARNACGGISNEDRETLNQELQHATFFDKIEIITEKYNIQYLLVANDKLINNLNNAGKIVLDFKFGDYNYYLVKLL